MLAAVLEWGAVGGTDLALPTWERGAICFEGEHSDQCFRVKARSVLS